MESPIRRGQRPIFYCAYDFGERSGELMPRSRLTRGDLSGVFTYLRQLSRYLVTPLQSLFHEPSRQAQLLRLSLASVSVVLFAHYVL
jgi:hypothetical protein